MDSPYVMYVTAHFRLPVRMFCLQNYSDDVSGIWHVCLFGGTRIEGQI
jgi:hypothetical protein